MDHKVAVETIAKVEQEFDVNRLRCAELPVWILIRLALWQHLLKPDADQKPRSLQSPLNRDTAQTPQQIQEALQKLTRQLPDSPTEILFISRPEDYADQIQGKFYNRHIDPLIDLVRDRHRYLKLELQTPKRKATEPRVEPTLFIRANQLVLDPAIQSTPWPTQIQNFADLQHLIQSLVPTITLSEADFVMQVHKILYYADCFQRILPILAPKAVFLVCYYAIPALALIYACRRQGIPTVDIQHGKQGIYHGLYSHWTSVPAQGYELLPRYFWTWGRRSQQTIAQWQPDPCPHQPIVGGNRWLAQWKEMWQETRKETAMDASQSDPIPAGMTKRILVSLQPADPVFPPQLVEAIQRSPSDWFWLLRLHPRQQRDRPNLEQQRQDLNLPDRAVLHDAIDYHLYKLMNQVNHHLTCWSSVGYEALAFDIPTTIIHPSGWQLYTEDIRQGYFSYADTADEILRAIANGRDTATANQDPYIETNQAIAEQAITTILNPSG